MGVGTSDGSYYDDAFHQAAAEWDPKYETNDNMVVTPDQLYQNQKDQQQDLTDPNLGGIEV